MIDEYELYHGAVIRRILASSTSPLKIGVSDFSGRTNAYVLNRKVGIYLKHSAKRMSPWQFTFPPDQLAEFGLVTSKFPKTFAMLVCGRDGIVAVDAAEIRELLGEDTATQGWIRVTRSKRSMYSLSGSFGELRNKLPNGVNPVLEAIGDN